MSDDMPGVIYTKPDNHTPSAGTYCDVNDGGTKYIRADLVPGWQPIETAPCDKKVLITDGIESPTTAKCSFANANWYEWDSGECLYDWPEYWQPLPEPPQD